MKRILNPCLYFLPLLIMIVALVSACKKTTENGAPPVISSIRNYVASPNDTVLHSAVANGQWVVITGQNLQNATQITFDGVAATFNTALAAPNSAVVQIPNIVFSQIDTAKLYTVQYATIGGSTTFSFKLGPAAPTVTAISNVFANPGDSVYVYGANLVLVQRFSYGGTAISSFKPSIDGTSIGFIMPAQTSTDQVLVTTKSGSVAFKIVATPTITGVSNENANAGDSVYIYGTYFKSIQSITFAGTAITSFKSSSNGNSIGFVLPALTKSGPVSVTTKFGTATTVYNVNDIATGSISNWEWSGNFNWQWWGGANLNSGDPTSGWPPYNPDFKGNSSLYMSLKNGVMAPAEGNTFSNYAILMNGAQWVPTANLNDAPGNWAFKFEVNIPQGWNGGTIDILSGVAGYVARWEPWQKSTTTASYSTKGWITVTIPLTSFRAKDATLGDGMGAPISKIADLTGPTGNTACTVYIHNYSTSATATGFYGAFDNLRVVKIK